MKKLSPTALSILAIGGLIGTAVTAVRSTPKAEELVQNLYEERFIMNGTEPTKIEVIQVAWKCYIPSILFGLSTATCILGANHLNRKQQASLMSAYALLDRTYKDYKAKTEALYSEETPEEVKTAVIKDLYSKEDHNPDAEAVIFYEENYGELFERTIEQVQKAEYLLNRKYALDGEANLNDFYKFLDLKQTETGNILGWSKIIRDNKPSYKWIDFVHTMIQMDDGMECYSIDMPFAPVPGYDLPF